MSLWNADGTRCTCADCRDEEDQFQYDTWDWAQARRKTFAAKKRARDYGVPVIVATQKREEEMHVDV
jgi:hypothetical protein